RPIRGAITSTLGTGSAESGAVWCRDRQENLKSAVIGEVSRIRELGWRYALAAVVPKPRGVDGGNQRCVRAGLDDRLQRDRERRVPGLCFSKHHQRRLPVYRSRPGRRTDHLRRQQRLRSSGSNFLSEVWNFTITMTAVDASSFSLNSLDA